MDNSSEKYLQISNLSLYWGSFIGTLAGMLITTGEVFHEIFLSDGTKSTVFHQDAELPFFMICMITVINCIRHFFRRNIEAYQKKEQERYDGDAFFIKISLFVLYTTMVACYGVTVALFGLRMTYLIAAFSLIQSLVAIIAWSLTGYAKLLEFEKGSYEQKSFIIILGDIYFLIVFGAVCLIPLMTVGVGIEGDKLWLFLILAVVFFVMEFLIVYLRELKRLGRTTFKTSVW